MAWEQKVTASSEEGCLPSQSATPELSRTKLGHWHATIGSSRRQSLPCYHVISLRSHSGDHVEVIQRLLASIRTFASASTSQTIYRNAPAASSAIYPRSSLHTSAASSSSTLAKPEFSCVDANERRGQKLQRLAEQAKAASCSTPAAADRSSVAFPCVDANEAREDRLRAQLGSPQLSEEPLHHRARSTTRTRTIVYKGSQRVSGLPPLAAFQAGLRRGAARVRSRLRDVGAAQRGQEQRNSTAYGSISIIACREYRVESGQGMVGGLCRA